MTVLSLNIEGRGRGDVTHADAPQVIGDAAFDVTEEPTAGINTDAFINDGVVGRRITRVAALNLVTDRQITFPECGLFERVFKDVGDAACLQFDAELLTAAAIPALGVGEVEVTLGVLDVANELLHRAIARTKAHRTSAALFDDDAEVALVWNRRRHRDEPDLFKELRVTQAGLGDADAGQVKDFAGAQRQLTCNHGGARLSVPLDIHGTDGVPLPFLNFKGHRDSARLEVGCSEGFYLDILVAHLPVILPELLGGGI